MAIDDGIGIAETACRLSISSKILANLVTQAKQAIHAPESPAKFGEQDAELQRLRRENARLRMECEILKKATAYFARELLSWPVVEDYKHCTASAQNHGTCTYYQELWEATLTNDSSCH